MQDGNSTIGLGLSAPLGPLGQRPLGSSLKIKPENQTEFNEMFKNFLEDVNHLQNKSSESIQKMVAGEIKDPHQVMLAMGEAKMALNLLVEIRNKVMEAYREVINMRG